MRNMYLKNKYNVGSRSPYWNLTKSGRTFDRKHLLLFRKKTSKNIRGRGPAFFNNKSDDIPTFDTKKRSS